MCVYSLHVSWISLVASGFWPVSHRHVLDCLWASLIWGEFLGAQILSQAHSQHCHLHGCGTCGLFVLSSAYYLWVLFWNSKRVTLHKRKLLSPTKKFGCYLCVNTFFSQKVVYWFQNHNLFLSSKILCAEEFHLIAWLEPTVKGFARLLIGSSISCRILLLHQSKGGGKY